MGLSGGLSTNGTFPLSQADRIANLLRGTVTSYRESFDRRAGGTQALAPTSGTITGAVIPVLAGDSFTQVIFTTHSTAATFGTNNDGHWWLGVWDDATGNTLLAATADQGHAAIAASSNFLIPLTATYTPASDMLVRVGLMIYLGTGGTPVAPTLRQSVPGGGGSGNYVTGQPRMGITGTTGITSGTVSSTWGTEANIGDVPYMALSA